MKKQVDKWTLLKMRESVRRRTDRRTDGRYQVHYLPRFAVDKYLYSSGNTGAIFVYMMLPLKYFAFDNIGLLTQIVKKVFSTDNNISTL